MGVVNKTENASTKEKNPDSKQILKKINDVICRRPLKKICFAVSIKKVTTQKKISEKSQVGSDSFLFFLATSNKKKA